MLPTIFAPATPAGRSALSVLRIAGPDTFSIIKKLAPNRSFTPRKAKLTKLYALDNNLLDEALVLLFKGPHSYTGEDIAELYLHGSPAVSRAVQNAIISTKLARYAEPGEFTKRAFSNNRLDLAQVEGIRDLLAAETETQRQSAIGGASGVFSAEYHKWRKEIVHASALLAAHIDFAEDNDAFGDGMEDESIYRVRKSVLEIKADVNKALETSHSCSELVRSGLKIALLGEPNAGKSSLTNKLVQRAASIVSDVPGTTRDVLEIGLEIGGHKVILFDTAGIRDASDKVEKLGIERAREALKSADIILALQPPSSDPLETNTYEQMGINVIKLQSKCDLRATNQNRSGIPISSTTGEGIDKLIKAITDHCDSILKTSAASQLGIGMSTRARALLETEALPGLEACLQLLDRDVVMANAELQRAATAIGTITGDGITVNEVLDVVFGEFCIGK